MLLEAGGARAGGARQGFLTTNGRGQPGLRTHFTAVSRSRLPVQQATSTNTRTFTRDATAEILQAAISLALQTRLTAHSGIDVEVQSSALDLLNGKFGGMTVRGTRWTTPLKLTAQRIEVSVGDLAIDQGELLWQRRVKLKNVPAGSCTLLLSPQDLGNFMVHPIMTGGPASKAVRGQPFLFNPTSVRFEVHGPSVGSIIYQGRAGQGGAPHAVTMEAAAGARSVARPGAAHVPERVQVKTKRLTPHTPDPTGVTEAELGTALDALFNGLKLNLQGVELSQPQLRLVRAASGAASPHPLLLEIGMSLHLRDLPPLNMAF